MLDYYQVLGVSASASPADIRAAYRALAFQHHPDVSGADGALGRARFQQIQEAYDVLRHPKRRSEYDSLRSFSQGASRRAGDSGGFGEWNDLGCARAAAEDRERGFEEAFHEWFKRSGFAQRQREQEEWERGAAERRDRARAWAVEKEEAQLHKLRRARMREAGMQARAERHASVLRGFWQTHTRVTWVDGAVAALFLAGSAGLALRWKAYLSGTVAACETGSVPSTHAPAQSGTGDALDVG